MSEPETNVLAAISDGLVAAAEKAGASIMTVDARRRYPASGVAWTENAIVTCDHIIEREDDITVRLASGEPRAARLAGRDPGSDLAVLTVDGGALTPAERGGPAKVGQLVLALGRPEPSIMASLGVVSSIGGAWQTATGSTVEGYIRTDTTFYPGFSGGPLVDALGRVMGVNSSRLGRGAGLTLPAASVDAIVQALLKSGRVRRGYLGIATQPVPIPAALAAKLPQPQERGLMIMSVEPASPADAAGLMVGDILVAFGAAQVTDHRDLQRQLGAAEVGKAVTLAILHGGEPRSLSVTVGERE